MSATSAAAAAVLSLAMTLSGDPAEPPRHGPMSASPQELHSNSTLCGTRKGNCQMNAPYPVSSGCSCIIDGQRVSGRVIQ